MSRSIINPLIEPLARELYRLKTRGHGSCISEPVDPSDDNTRDALTHFNALPHVGARLVEQDGVSRIKLVYVCERMST